MEPSLAPISIIIPTFNDAHFLKNCIDSINQQSKLPLEVIVVDDGSNNENARAVVDLPSFQDLNLKFIKIKNSGPSTARNAGHEISKAEFILFLDADDILPSNALDLYSHILQELDEEFFGVSGQMENFGRIFNPKHPFISENNVDITQLGRKGGLQGQISCFVLRSKYFQSVKKFNQELTHYEDFELLLKLFSKWKLKTINSIVLRKRFHAQSLSNKNYQNSFIGGKKFLHLVRTKSLLPEIEISKREKENFLTYGKQLFLHARFISSLQVFRDCFNAFQPEGLKEQIVAKFSMYF